MENIYIYLIKIFNVNNMFYFFLLLLLFIEFILLVKNKNKNCYFKNFNNDDV